MFADFEVLGGDFLSSKESHIYHGWVGRFKAALKGEQFLLSELLDGQQQKLTIPLSDALKFQEVDVESVNAGDAAVLGLLGGIALGPLGLLAGGAVGALNKKKVFVIEFSDGRRLVGSTSKLAFSNLKQTFTVKELLGK